MLSPVAGAGAPCCRRGLPCAVAALALAACAMPIRQFDLKNQALTCAQANEYAYRSLQNMGFSIIAFDPAGVGRAGDLHGTREDRGSTQKVTVTIACTGSGADIVASEDNRWVGLLDFKRGFYFAFTATVAQASVTAAAAREEAERPLDQKKRKGLQVALEPLPGASAKLEFDFDLAAARILPLRVTINNVTTRVYALDPADIVLIQADGTRVRPLPIAASAQQVADAMRGSEAASMDVAAIGRQLQMRLLQTHSVPANQTVSGFLYYPLAAYVKGRVSLEDQASEESEGFLVEFR